MTRVTLSGFYGFGNAGDEAVLAGLVQSLKAARADVQITVLSGDPAETRRTHNVDAAHRYRPAELLSALRRTDVLLSGGGSLLQDVTSAHSIFYYLGVVRLAQLLGKRTMFAAQGVGPLNLPRSRKLTAAVANKCDALTVRDPQSAQLLADIGVRRPVEVTADPALLLTLQREYKPPKSMMFGVALRPWPGHDALPSLVADACANVFPEGRAFLFPMQRQSDIGPAEQFGEKWLPVNRMAVHQDKAQLSALLHNIGACQLMVGMRLHALILAAACGVPSVALSYDPKVAAFMAQAGQADAVWNLTDGTDALTGLLARAWAQRQERSEALLALLPTLRAAAARTAQIALSLTE